MVHKIKRGLDLPISGSPEQRVEDGPPVRTVALVGADYVGMKPTMDVREGDRVKLGQSLFTDKKNAAVRYTAPAAGTIVAVNRGEKRVFQSIVIELDGQDEETFQTFSGAQLSAIGRDAVRNNLVQSGLWNSFRARPFSKAPPPESVPHSLFVQAIDTNPLAPNPALIINERPDLFRYGLSVVQQLTDGPTYVCKSAESSLEGCDVAGVRIEDFDGPHPAGLPGTHIHVLDPVSVSKTVWHINYQDVIAIGNLFATGRLSVERVVSLAGPQVAQPRLLRTRIGASLADLTRDQLKEGENRVISGSVLSGRTAAGPQEFLGRYHLQVSVIREEREREFLGWQRPGGDMFSVKRVFLSGFAADGRRFNFSTNMHGSRRAMVPIGMYEKVMPLDVLPTFLLRSLIIGDTDQALALGALELDEEDLALCTFVCPGKYEYGPILRRSLTTIEKEG
jgi:Na+-transporting NADH:ubiquinone oxidoreductase subunit A